MDSIFNSVGGAFKVFKIGDVFGGLLEGILGLGGTIASGIFGFLEDWVIPFVQDIGSSLFEWVLDFFNLTDLWEQAVSLYEFLQAILVIIWLVAVFLNVGFPLTKATLTQSSSEIMPDYYRIWMFDCTFGISILGFKVQLPFLLVTVLFTIIFATTYEIDWILPLFPWV